MMGRSGNVKPSLADDQIVPKVTGVVWRPTANEVVTPTKVSVAVLAPVPSVMELVPDPEHGMVDTHVKMPCDVNVVLKTTLPSGKTVNGSARAVHAERKT